MNLIHVKKRARDARGSVGRTERTVSRTQSDAYTHENKEGTKLTKNNTSSTTHTATKRRPAITKSPADEPTREDKEDVGPSARATAGKRASTASTKVRNNHSRSCVFFSLRTTYTEDRTKQTKTKQSTKWWLFVVCVLPLFVLLFHQNQSTSSTDPSTDPQPVRSSR